MKNFFNSHKDICVFFGTLLFISLHRGLSDIFPAVAEVSGPAAILDDIAVLVYLGAFIIQCIGILIAPNKAVGISIAAMVVNVFGTILVVVYSIKHFAVKNVVALCLGVILVLISAETVKLAIHGKLFESIIDSDTLENDKMKDTGDESQRKEN